MKIIDLEQEDGRCPWHDMLPQGLIRTCHKRAHEDWGDPQQTIGKRRGSSERYKRCHLRVVMWRTRHRQQRDEVPRTLYDWEQWEYGERGRTLSLLFLHPSFFFLTVSTRVHSLVTRQILAAHWRRVNRERIFVFFLACCVVAFRTGCLMFRGLLRSTVM